MPDNPYKAYSQNPNTASGTGGYQNIPQQGSPAYTEAWALVESARRMASVLESGPFDDTEVRKAIRDSLRLNWRLWTIFQSELTVGDGAEGLPADIRQNMLTLCKFVDKHTIGVMAEPTPEGIATLIDINRNIASGLLEQFTREDEGDEQKASTEETQTESEPESSAAEVFSSFDKQI